MGLWQGEAAHVLRERRRLDAEQPGDHDEHHAGVRLADRAAQPRGGGAVGSRLEPGRRDPRLRSHGRRRAGPGHARGGARGRARRGPGAAQHGRTRRHDRRLPAGRRRLHRRQLPEGGRLHLESRRRRTRPPLRARARARSASPDAPRGMLLGIDIGSSGVKAALVDPETGVLAAAQEPAELFSPHAGWAEADPHQWWDAVCALVPRLLGASGRVAGEIEAVAASGMVPAVLALDERGRPLRRAILQNDARATAELAELSELLADIDLLGLTGSSLTQQSVAPTLRWLERHEPDLFAGTATVTGSYDWVARMLGAEPHVERNWAIESGLFDLEGPPAGAGARARRDLRGPAAGGPLARARWWARSAPARRTPPACARARRSSSAAPTTSARPTAPACSRPATGWSSWAAPGTSWSSATARWSTPGSISTPTPPARGCPTAAWPPAAASSAGWRA